MKKSHLMYFLLAMMLLVGACAPKQATSNADEVARQIETSVASTVAIGNALTAAVPANTNTALPPTSTDTPAGWVVIDGRLLTFAARGGASSDSELWVLENFLPPARPPAR